MRAVCISIFQLFKVLSQNEPRERKKYSTGQGDGSTLDFRLTLLTSARDYENYD